MTRFLLLVIQVFVYVVLAAPVCADDPTKKLTSEERKELEAKRERLITAGVKAYQAGKYPDANASFEESLKLARKLYNTTEFPNGHALLAAGMNDLATLYQVQGKLFDAELLFKDALEMSQRLCEGGDEPDLANIMNGLATLYRIHI